MKQWKTAGAALLAAASLATGARAGVYTDDMSKCLVKSSGEADRVVLVQWIFAEISLHPTVKSLSGVTPAARDGYEKGGAALVQRLMLHDCRAESLMAIKYEGRSAIEASFGVLGQVAMRDLIADPTVAAGMGSMAKDLDVAEWTSFLKEAGEAPPAK